MGRTFHGHRSANIGVREFDLFLREAKFAQHIKGDVVQLSIREAKRLGAKGLTKGPFVEGELDVEGIRHCRLQHRDLCFWEPFSGQCGVTNGRRMCHGQPHSG